MSTGGGGSGGGGGGGGSGGGGGATHSWTIGSDLVTEIGSGCTR